MVSFSFYSAFIVYNRSIGSFLLYFRKTIPTNEGSIFNRSIEAGIIFYVPTGSLLWLDAFGINSLDI